MNNAGTYDAENNTLAVLDNTDMKIQTYFEELIHAGQDRVYYGGIAQYYDRGKPNIEFEASLTKDLVYYIEGGIYNAGAGIDNKQQYAKWIETLCDDTQVPLNYSFPSAAAVVGTKVEIGNVKKGYYEMMEDFKKKYT